MEQPIVQGYLNSSSIFAACLARVVLPRVPGLCEYLFARRASHVSVRFVFTIFGAISVLFLENRTNKRVRM